MVPADIPDVVAMIHALSAFHDDTGTVSIDSVTRDTQTPNPWWHCYVAERGTDLIGYMVLLPLAKIADGLRGIDINHLYIRDTERGTGIGRALIDVAKTHAAANDCSYLHIATAPDNTAAQAAYLACGFDSRPDAGGPRFRMSL
jgi:GNAT superfamily N-acetyltransferase